MSEKPDPVLLVSQSLLQRFGVDAGKRLPEVARELGLDVVYRQAESYEGALLRIKGVPRGCVVINSGIREESRKRFTLAHELGHFVLPGQQDLSSPCQKEKIENWDEQLLRPELEANRFAAEILMPRKYFVTYLGVEPTMESVRSISGHCETSLTASAFQLMTLTTYRACVVWSQKHRVRWYKSSDDFVRWIRKGELDGATFAADCFKNRPVPDRLEPVPASAWLFEKGLKEDAQIWEHSIPLPNYDAVLSLLVMREPVEAWDDSAPAEEELDPNEFTVNRRRWPSKSCSAFRKDQQTVPCSAPFSPSLNEDSPRVLEGIATEKLFRYQKNDYEHCGRPRGKIDGFLRMEVSRVSTSSADRLRNRIAHS